MDSTEIEIINVIENFLLSAEPETITASGFYSKDPGLDSWSCSSLCTYIKTINNGKASNSFGISDNRIEISNGTSLIKGYLIVSFGSNRIIVKTKFKKLDYQFFFQWIKINK